MVLLKDSFLWNSNIQAPTNKLLNVCLLNTVINFGKRGGEEQGDGGQEQKKKKKVFIVLCLGLCFSETSQSEEAHVREKSWREKQAGFMKGTWGWQ